MTEPNLRRRERQIKGWEFMCLESANLIAWTEDREFFEEWLAEVKAGEWGDVGVAAVDHEGFAVELLWPPEPKAAE